MAPRRVEKTDQDWKEQLTGEEYAVCRQAGTEPAFTGVYNDCKDDGLYRCRCCDLELFHSNTKYESGSGWPSFWEPVDEANVVTVTDSSLGMIRTEVLCAGCDAHLGHVFPDGPEPTGQRFCMNSLSLRHEKD
jgi:peptide-methionine (R)-S-oxide reductase